MSKKLVYYGGDGFSGLKPEGDYHVHYVEDGREEVIKEYINFKQAKKFYDKLKCPKAFWHSMELIDAYTYE